MMVDVEKLAAEAINLTSHPGYAHFTNGTITTSRNEHGHLVIATDNRWAASAIRTRLRRAGCAIEGDALNEGTTVTVWPIGQSDETPLPGLQLTELRDRAGTTVILEGPDGVVEQQCGSGGHNDLIVHACHPFRSAVSVSCARHGGICWVRASWPWKLDARRFISLSYESNGVFWRPSPKAIWRLRSIYRIYIHQTRMAATASPAPEDLDDLGQLALFTA